MKKLLILIAVVCLVTTMQAQDVTNTLGAGGDFKVNQNDGTNIFTIKEDGKVGIGTDTPNSLFEVNGSVSKPITIITTTDDYTADETDYTIVYHIDGSGKDATLTLPSASTCKGRFYYIRTTNGNSSSQIKIQAASGDKIFGKTDEDFIEIGNPGIFASTTWSVLIQSDGVNRWWVISAIEE